MGSAVDNRIIILAGNLGVKQPGDTTCARAAPLITMMYLASSHASAALNRVAMPHPFSSTHYVMGRPVVAAIFIFNVVS